MKIPFCIVVLLFFGRGFSQHIDMQLEKAITVLQQDEQFRHAAMSLAIIDALTGKNVYAYNAQTGLAPASCQKIITSASAFELLGKDYRYKTQLSYDGKINGNTLEGNLFLTGNGDPTLGSWRWKETNAQSIFSKLLSTLDKLKISRVNNFIIDNTKWGTQALPDGWVWQDIGNYYGAGCSSFNWHENQFDIVLKPGAAVGDSVKILSADPLNLKKTFNELTTGAKGTGDQAYVYYSPYSSVNFLRGTIPLGVDSLIISASATDGVPLFINEVNSRFLTSRIAVSGKNEITDFSSLKRDGDTTRKQIVVFISPALDSINYWFLKKSVNLYGEAFVKTIAWEKRNAGSTDTGVNIIKDFWAEKGIEKSSLKIIDGSGLSPANRITAAALVQVLEFAKKRPWFTDFFNALPEINGIRMKDGYIGGVRSYAGYITSSSGKQYIFAFIVNNFDGNPGMAREKMWKVLNVLK